MYQNNFEIISSLDELAKIFIQLSPNKKRIYENYSNEFKLLRFKLRDIYDAIHGVVPKTPAGALRIFLQEKAINNEISSLKEGISIWKNLSLDEKEDYLRKCHLQFLAYKYKESLYNKKISRFLPQKPEVPFIIFAKKTKGYIIPKGENTLDYLRKMFNNLNSKKKDELNNEYRKNMEIYNKKINIINNKFFDFPNKPKSAFVFFFKDKVNIYSGNISLINVYELIKIILSEWIKNKEIEDKYFALAEKDKIRFENQVEEFEKFGYYSENIELN